jgi:hypothetical protein
VRSQQAPEQLLAEADLILDGPPGVRNFLEQLVI